MRVLESTKRSVRINSSSGGLHLELSSSKKKQEKGQSGLEILLGRA